WIATVGNSCWPSKPGLSTEQQKAELTAILDRAVALKLNAVIFQVRPACDALYQSSLEPWSEYLTGIQGRAPAPFYDPLAFAVAEAHQRGLELHAWFNPFRAHHAEAVSPIAGNHISRTRPDLIRSYGKYLWLDPGEPEVRDFSLRVVLDVVRRYDVDGVHFDDYFYPYHEKNSAGQDAAFPDGASWSKYGVKSGLARDDWRRANVDAFMQKLYHSVKAEKPWVKVGISPFGIWRPQNPPGIKGFDSYAELYADSRKWLAEGWCDYFSPQLYWGIQPPAQSFPALLGWWNAQNVRHRHIWPGMNTLKTDESWSPAEIANEIALTRDYANPGHIHWSVTALMKNAALDAVLTRNVYHEVALVPASPWLDASAPAKPDLSNSVWSDASRLKWQSGPGEPVREWVLQTRTKGAWTTQILPASRTEARVKIPGTDAVAVRAVNRVGNLSEPAIWVPRKYSTPDTARGMNSPKQEEMKNSQTTAALTH
ncbi:MAG: family 10 glycosylhydrolase, partial [Verrucomicrobiae bacterium]|nr:family 10 glycosylhydrolase [Verrucomicrobiae bacterium]